MLTVLSLLFETIKSIAYYSIFLSYNTGKLICNALVVCYNSLNKIFNILWTVLVIISEDLLVFLSDVWNRLCVLFGAFDYLSNYVGDTVLSFYCGVKNLICGTADMITNIVFTIGEIVTKSYTAITSLIAGIKHLVVLFGSGVWFVVTLIPVFIIYLCMMATYYIGRAFEELKTIVVNTFLQIVTGLHDVIYFVIDVPLEAIAGLLVCFCLLYAIIKFHVVLLSNISRIIRNLLTTVQLKLSQLKTMIVSRRFRRTTARQAIRLSISSEQESSDSDNAGTDSDSMDTDDVAGPLDEEIKTTSEGWMTKRERNQQILKREQNENCIICTERSKCMLFMPCRHLSTCAECTDKLKRYQQNCPICRSFINYTIHVY